MKRKKLGRVTKSHSDTDRHTDNRVISYASIYFFLNKESRLIRYVSLNPALASTGLSIDLGRLVAAVFELMLVLEAPPATNKQ
jgi:hypothetical protein